MTKEAGDTRPPGHHPAPCCHTVTRAPPWHHLGACTVPSSFATAPVSFRTHGHAGATLQQHTGALQTQQKGLGCAAGLPAAPEVPQHHPSMRSHPPGLQPSSTAQQEKQTHRVPAGTAPCRSPSSGAPAQGDGAQHPGAGEQGPNSLPSFGVPTASPPHDPQPTGLHRVPTIVPSCLMPTCPCQTHRPGPAAARSGGLGANSEEKPMCVAPFSKPAAAPC